MNPAVVVVGSYVQDLSWRCEKFPQPGETVVGKFALGPGGKGSNQAVAAARAGASTCFVGAIGADAFGREARRYYRAERIPARFVEKPSHATGTAAILVNAKGENEIVVALGANAALTPRDIDAALIRRAKVVAVQLESNLAATAHVLRTARAAGVTTILNPAPMRADFAPALLAQTDVLIPNETEFIALMNARSASADAGAHRRLTEAKLSKLAPHRLHALCRTLEVRTVILTLGARGCFVSQLHAYRHLEGHRGIHVVDTTGAGDAFVGGFAAGLVRFAGNIERAAEFANAAAALSVTKPGTAPSMPREREITRFLQRRVLSVPK